uniref:G domain-containing protein n=1 Tax=Strongyloides papillosus TaxID=174720 RepID=A0A0N5CD26_STREA
MSQNVKKFLRFAIIGAPNVGKSLLTNQLVKANVAAVSKRMDTTRTNLTAAYTNNSCQLVCVDSPGLVGIQHATSVSEGEDLTILTDPEKAMKKAEHILVVQDATHTGDYLHHRAMFLLHKYSHVPSTLVINKVDLIKDRSTLLPLVKILTHDQVGGQKIATKRVSFGRLGKLNEDRLLNESKNGIPLYEKGNFNIEGLDEKQKGLYRRLMSTPYDKCSWNETKKVFLDIRGWPNFESVFFVSSLTGEGIDGLRDYLLKLSSPGKWIYDENTLTTKNPKDICLDQIRAECLNFLPQEVGYGIKLKIMEWNFINDRDHLNIIIELVCKNKRWAKLLLQTNPSKLDLIEETVNNAVQNLINQPLYIKLLVKYKGKTVTVDNHESL